MITMDLQELPPSPYLEQLLDHTPRAARTYVKLWRLKDDENCVYLLKRKVKEKFLISYTQLYNDLLVIAREGLASVEERPMGLYVTFTGWDLDD